MTQITLSTPRNYEKGNKGIRNMKNYYTLIKTEEGEETNIATGSIAQLVKYLENHPELYDWILEQDPEAEMPDLSDVEVERDLQHELDKIDLSWWSLTIEEC